jgi:hypothetical protein
MLQCDRGEGVGELGIEEVELEGSLGGGERLRHVEVKEGRVSRGDGRSDEAARNGAFLFVSIKPTSWSQAPGGHHAYPRLLI